MRLGLLLVIAAFAVISAPRPQVTTHVKQDTAVVVMHGDSMLVIRNDTTKCTKIVKDTTIVVKVDSTHDFSAPWLVSAKKAAVKK